ncbi:hypothetical protein ACLWBD_00460 [Bdellovibrio sp. HCB117]|uniref:hypothetical protein n=1 Tax=Bdellovibrio sp. HCB117 TaxID=3394359 RepID=UPI0039B53E7D
MNKDKKADLIEEAIQECRSIVLHTIQFELNDSPHWHSIRSRILRAFGDKGLSARVQKIFAEKDNSGGSK